MKTVAFLNLSLLFACAMAPLRAQDGAIDIGASSAGQLSASGGTITITSDSTVSSGGSVIINNAATLVSDSGTLLLRDPSDGTTTNFLATQAGLSTITFAGTTTNVLSSTAFQNLATGATTAVVTGGTLTFAPNLTIATTTNTLVLGGNVVATGSVNLAAQQLVFPYQSTLVFNPSAGLAPLMVTAASLQSNVVAGVNFNLVPALTDFGGMGTTVQLLGGAASVNRTVLTAFSASPITSASDDVNVSGTISDTYVLELSYSQAAALSLPGGPNAMQLQWLDPNTGVWENAIDGNTGGTPTFVNGAYNPAVDFNLGTYGVDTTNQEVWAVINHNSQFTVDTQAPEPGGWALFSCGLTGLLATRRFRRGK